VRQAVGVTPGEPQEPEKPHDERDQQPAEEAQDPEERPEPRLDPASYGDAFADVYDDWYGVDGDAETAAAVDRLADLSGGGPVLELGVGTGRLAIPLAARGLDVWGLDASRAMLERLRAKSGGERVTTVEADMVSFDLGDRQFGLVFAVFNTLCNLAGRNDQVRGLSRAAAHLVPGGRVIVEMIVPSDARVSDEPVVEVSRLERDRVVLSVSRAVVRDGGDGVVEGHHVDLSAGGVRLRPWRVRLVTPSELDDLANQAGLRLEQRWSDWCGNAFDDGTSPRHVSVYTLASGA
jgi:SAM-dependent methyltransferase